MAYNRGRGTANNLAEVKGNQYANKILRLWNRFKVKKHYNATYNYF